MRIDYANLLKITTFAHLKHCARNAISVMIEYNKIDSIRICGLIFIILNNKAIFYIPNNDSKPNIDLDLKLPKYIDTENLMTITNFSRIKKVVTQTARDWIRKDWISSIKIDGVTFVLLDDKAKLITKNEEMVLHFNPPIKKM